MALVMAADASVQGDGGSAARGRRSARGEVPPAALVGGRPLFRFDDPAGYDEHTYFM